MKYAALTVLIALVSPLLFPATTAIAGDVDIEIIYQPNRGYYYHGYYYNPDYVVVDEEYVIKTYRRPRRYRHRRIYRPSWPSSTIVIEESHIETEIVPIIE